MNLKKIADITFKFPKVCNNYFSGFLGNFWLEGTEILISVSEYRILLTSPFVI